MDVFIMDEILLFTGPCFFYEQFGLILNFPPNEARLVILSHNKVELKGLSWSS